MFKSAQLFPAGLLPPLRQTAKLDVRPFFKVLFFPHSQKYIA
jgi:hypothetical protein